MKQRLHSLAQTKGGDNSKFLEKKDSCCASTNLTCYQQSNVSMDTYNFDQELRVTSRMQSMHTLGLRHLQTRIH